MADTTILEYYYANRQSRFQLKYKTELTKEIKYIIHKFCSGTNGKFFANNVNIIGSSVSGTADAFSDLDLNVTVNQGRINQDSSIVFLDLLSHYFTSMDKSNEISDLQIIATARVPILKFQYKDTLIDICVNNIKAEYNSQFVRSLVRVDPRVGPLIFMVKHFVKNAGLYGAMYVGKKLAMMSSYGWTLSVLYFLKDVRPSVISIPQWSAAYYGNKQNYHIKSENSLNLIQLFKVWLNHNCGDFGVWNNFHHRYEQTSFRFETMICPCTGINVCQTITPSGRQKILETLAYYSTYFETIPPEIFYQASKVPSKEVSKVSFNWFNLTQVLRIN